MSIPLKIDRSVITYRNAASRSFEFFKRTTLLDDLTPEFATAERRWLSAADMRCTWTMTLARGFDALCNENVTAYPSQFVATPISTKAWLRDRVLAVPDRMLFLLSSVAWLAIWNIRQRHQR